MSEPARLFSVPVGADFPEALVNGLDTRFDELAPHDWARITLILNTRRMARRVRAIFDAGPPRLLPRILLLSDVETLLTTAPPPPAVSGLRRKLDLSRLVARLLAERKELAAETSVFDLAESLANLMDEMQGEGVSPDAISGLDVSNHSEHFAQTQAFLAIVETYLESSEDMPDSETRQRRITEALIGQWQKAPPTHPIILAGSTASRGTTRLLAETFAGLENGYVVLPGFDTHMPEQVWSSLDHGHLPAEDHPQYRFFALMQSLDIAPTAITPWGNAKPNSTDRNRLVSLALRPAPVTDAWRQEGPSLGDLRDAAKDVTLIEADSPRSEALAIALRLRKAAEDGQSAALITPDRMLTRQVAAALDPWNIIPDDSAGLPMHLSPAGRFLRHVAGAFFQPMTVEALLTLLKHPSTHNSETRNLHNLNTQRLELAMRNVGMPFPDPESMDRITPRLVKAHGEDILPWLAWVKTAFLSLEAPGDRPLYVWVAQHIKASEFIARGSVPDESENLWHREDGQKGWAVLNDLADHAEDADTMNARDYVSLLQRLLSAEEVRNTHTPHPDIMIWGTLEARVQGADLVILAGLNDGTWPEQPAPDPWLNRALRQKAGLLLPDRRIGLSAHDFQQAIAAKDVWITRSVRTSEAETVPSRWLNRMMNLMSGLPENFGPDAMKEMTDRGNVWLAKAKRFETPIESEKTKRPAPRPPVATRPRVLSVSDVRMLIRDPFGIYAKHVLGLRPLGPLVPQPDALERGIALHSILEQFVKFTLQQADNMTADKLISLAHAHLERDVPWPAMRRLWQGRMSRIADGFVVGEAQRQAFGQPTAFEEDATGKLELADLGMTITARADRIDQTDTGDLIIYDYKSGKPPTAKQQIPFERQLLIEAAMAEMGGFAKLGSNIVQKAQYIGLDREMTIVDAPLEDEPPHKVMAELRELLAAYLTQTRGYLARRAMLTETAPSDFDHLSRFGEWDTSDDPHAEDLS